MRVITSLTLLDFLESLLRNGRYRFATLLSLRDSNLNPLCLKTVFELLTPEFSGTGYALKDSYCTARVN